MQVLGIDFTSAPSARKPLVCAVGWLEGERLQIQRLDAWRDFTGLEGALRQPGPWVAGLDFPFGFPRAFSTFQGLPPDWEAGTTWLERFHTADHKADRARYRQWIKAYRNSQPPGAKHPLRLADKLAGAVSPLMLYGVPVGMMLLEGAPRLRQAACTVLGLRLGADDRVTLEAYPGLAVVGLLGGKVRYKTERRQSDPEHRANRARLLSAAGGRSAVRTYGLRLQVTRPVSDACLADQSGDRLDALLCALQAAWAYRQRANGWGLPPDLPGFVSASEGWIFDPQVLARWQARMPV